MAIDRTGTEILGYRLVEQLGAGGMATVWRAQHTLLSSKQVAIKLLDPELARDATLVARFRTEADVQARLAHPNIVAVENFSTDPLAIVMEYVQGRSLADLIGRGVGPMPIARALPLIRPILDAVAHAHAAGVIHRDIKPSNVLVTEDGTVKVMDFGIARIVGGVRLTRTRSSMGTAAYMSPEQILGAHDADERSDVYSLGVTCYELLAGRTPFEGPADSDSDFLVRRAHVEQPPPDPREFYPAIPQTVVDVLLQALAKDPAARFPSVGAFREALEAAAAGARVAGAPPQTARPAAAPASATARAAQPAPGRPRWVLPAALGGAAAVLLALGVILLPTGSSAPPPVGGPGAPRRERAAARLSPAIAAAPGPVAMAPSVPVPAALAPPAPAPAPIAASAPPAPRPVAIVPAAPPAAAPPMTPPAPPPPARAPRSADPADDCPGGIVCPPHYAVVYPHLERICDGTYGDRDLYALRAAAADGEVEKEDLLYLFNAYGIFDGYSWRKVTKLNGFFYDERAADWLPPSCLTARKAYDSHKSVPSRLYRYRRELRAVFDTL